MTARGDDRVLLRALLERSPVVEAPDDGTLCDYLAGRLDEEDAERVRAWVAADPAAAERLLELEPFALAEPPRAGVADLAAHGAWRDAGRRRPRTAAPPARQTRRWPIAVAALFFLATCGLSLRLWQLEVATERPVANLRTLELLGDVRAGETTKRFEIVRGQPFRVAIYPAAPPEGCDAYRAVVRDVEIKGAAPVEIDGLVADARGRLDLLLPGAPGARVLELEACDQPRGRFRFDLVAE